MRIGEPAFFIVFGFYKVNSEPPRPAMIVAVFRVFLPETPPKTIKTYIF